jgi:hypothetical protein
MGSHAGGNAEYMPALLVTIATEFGAIEQVPELLIPQLPASQSVLYPIGLSKGSKYAKDPLG